MNIVIYGASRGVGRHAVEQAARSGHRVTAFARNPSGLADIAGVTRFVGDVTRASDVQRSLIGQDAALCTLGADDRRATTLYSTAMRNLVAAMPEVGVERLVCLANFGMLGERSWHPATALLAIAVRRTLAATLADHRRAFDHLAGSALRWTAVRPMRLTDGPLTERYRVVAQGLPFGGLKISRADVAHFLLEELTGDRFIGRSPALAY